MLLIYTLIILIAFLLGYQVFSEVFTNKLIEGLENEQPPAEKEYQPYNLSDPNNALILAQQNAGNIEVLKGRIDEFDGVKEKLDTMQQNINSNSFSIIYYKQYNKLKSIIFCIWPHKIIKFL